MKRRSFVKNTLTASVGLGALTSSSAQAAPQQATGREYYELRVYELKGGGKQKVFENYFSQALIPALNNIGISKVGVFYEMGMPEPPKLYVLIPYQNIEQFATAAKKIEEQAVYKSNSTAYFESATPENPNFTRYESSLMLAFESIPQLKVPEQAERLFELRTYEGFDEDAVQRKIKMFNKEELPIFYKTGLHPVFFGEALIGDNLPQLTYMLAFKDMQERDQNWQKFIDDPEWKQVSGLSEYANTVSKIIRTFLKPTDYSQI